MLLIAEIQANLAWNKANKMVDKIQPYNLPLWLFRDKTLKQTLDLTCKLGTVDHNSHLPLETVKLLNHMNMNLLKHNNTPWSLYAEKHEMLMKQAWCDQAKMEFKKQTMAWPKKQSLMTTIFIHTWNEHLDIQANKISANHLHAQHLTNA